MKSCRSPVFDSYCKVGRKEPPVSASGFLADLPPEVTYAVERGLAEADQALTSDLDLVISKQGFLVLYALARQLGMVVSVTLSYGGGRLFIAFPDGGIKRIDCMWSCSYLGIPICSTRRLLAARQLDKGSGLSVLPEDMRAEVAFAVKNAYGGAEEYRALLERHRLEVMAASTRRRWLLSQAFRHPFATLTGLCRMMLAYAARTAVPSGIRVFGSSAAELRNSDVLRYLFQGRIRETGQLQGFIRSRLGSELCVVRSATQADLVLSDRESLEAAERAILIYLRHHRSGLPSLILTVS